MSSSVFVRREVRRRVFSRKLAKYGFILFNMLLLLAVLGSCSIMATSYGEEERKATVAAGVFLAVWGLGSLILGVLTLETRTTIEERKR